MRSLPSTAGLRSLADQARALSVAAKRRANLLKSEVSDLEDEQAQLDLVAELFRQLLDAEVTTGVQAVEKLLSEGLQAVFTDQDIKVRADVGTSRGKVSVDLVTLQKQEDGSITEGVSTDSFGGSVTTVQSVLLRITVILRRNLRLMVVGDEALPAFDENYIKNVGRFLTMLCKKLQLDALFVTHNIPWVESVENSYRIVKRNGGAVFERYR